MIERPNLALIPKYNFAKLNGHERQLVQIRILFSYFYYLLLLFAFTIHFTFTIPFTFTIHFYYSLYFYYSENTVQKVFSLRVNSVRT